MRGVHICTFLDGIDRMKRKDQRYADKVLRVIHECEGNVSVFEATDNAVIARMFERLEHDGHIVIDPSPGYPWWKVTLTAKGLRLAGLPPS